MKYKLNFWDYVFYISLLVLSIWVLLKITGVIQTPLWLEYGIPVFSIIFTAFAFYKNILDSVKEIAVGLATLNVKFNHLEKDVTILKTDVSGLKANFEVLKKHR